MSSEARRIAIIQKVVEAVGGKATGEVRSCLGVAASDDCAVLGLDAVDLVVGADFVRGTGFHLFELGVLSWEDIGWYVIGANASDLAAMGSRPIGATLILRYTSQMTDQECESIVRGVALACREFGMPLVGGDTGGYKECVLSATAFGICAPGTALLRSGGQAGDKLFVTGRVGRAGAAVAYFRRGREEGVALPEDLEEELAASWRRIYPAVNQGIVIRERGWSRCAIDTSDGLKAAVRQLAEASRVDAIVDPRRLPLDPIAWRVAREMDVDPVSLCLGDSVDFRLVFSAKPAVCAELRGEFEIQGWDLFEIGVLADAAAEPKVWLAAEGERVEVPGVEWSQSEKLAIDELRLGKRGGAR